MRLFQFLLICISYTQCWSLHWHASGGSNFTVPGPGPEMPAWWKRVHSPPEPEVEDAKRELVNTHDLRNNLVFAEMMAKCAVLEPLWKRAHSSLWQGRADNLGKNACRYIDWFDNPSCPLQSVNCTTRAEFPGVDMRYEAIFKNANTAISCNLREMARKQASGTPPSGGNGIKQYRFTFVRDPLARFVSAYGEIEYANLLDMGVRYSISRGPYLDSDFGSEQRAMEFIENMIAGRFAHDVNFGHLFTQVATIKQTNAVVAGNLEHFSEGWAKIQAVTKTSFAWDRKCGRHAETENTADNKPRMAMERLLDRLPSVRIALRCSYLLPDYACLDYVISADDCVSAGYAKDTDSWADLITKVKSMFCPTSVFENSDAWPSS